MSSRYLFPSDYMADPAVHVFNNRLYIYPSHDRDTGDAFDDDGGHFQMRDYHVLSLSGDPMTAEVVDHGVMLDQDQVPWVEKQMWDSDVVEKDGRYYLVFSAKDYNGEFHLIYCYYGGLWGGQLQWHVPLAAPFVPIAQPDTEPAPEGYVEIGHAPDKRTMLYAPADAPALTSFVARMSDDVLQFAEAPRPVVIVDADGCPLKASDPHRFFEASWMHKANGRYYFTYSTGDSHLLCMAVGDNPYGPFRFQCELLQPVVGWTTHHGIVRYEGRWWLFHHDCVPSNDITHLRSLKVMPLDDSLFE